MGSSLASLLHTYPCLFCTEQLSFSPGLLSQSTQIPCKLGPSRPCSLTSSLFSQSFTLSLSTGLWFFDTTSLFLLWVLCPAVLLLAWKSCPEAVPMFTESFLQVLAQIPPPRGTEPDPSLEHQLFCRLPFFYALLPLKHIHSSLGHLSLPNITYFLVFVFPVFLPTKKL